MDELGVHLLPRQLWHRLEGFGANQVDPLALTVELTVEERDDVQPVPDRRADDRIPEPDFFYELPYQGLDVGLAGLQSTARQRPSRRRRKLEANEQHAVIGVDHQS